MKIEEMAAGRELDALVAEKVMKWKEVTHENPGTNCRWWVPDRKWSDREFERRHGVRVLDMTTPQFSEDISQAWDVLEKIYEQTKHAKVLRIFKWKEFKTGRAAYGGPWACQYGESITFMFAETAPLAICRASLKVMEKNHGNDDGA